MNTIFSHIMTMLYLRYESLVEFTHMSRKSPHTTSYHAGLGEFPTRSTLERHHSSSPVEAPSSAEGSVEAPSSAVGSAFDNERRKGQYPDPPPHAIPRPAPSDSRNVANSIKTQSCIARAHFHIVTHITGFPGATSAADLGGPSPCAPSSCQRAFAPAWQSPR